MSIIYKCPKLAYRGENGNDSFCRSTHVCYKPKCLETDTEIWKLRPREIEINQKQGTIQFNYDG